MNVSVFYISVESPDICRLSLKKINLSFCYTVILVNGYRHDPFTAGYFICYCLKCPPCLVLSKLLMKIYLKSSICLLFFLLPYLSHAQEAKSNKNNNTFKQSNKFAKHYAIYQSNNKIYFLYVDILKNYILSSFINLNFFLLMFCVRKFISLLVS